MPQAPVLIKDTLELPKEFFDGLPGETTADTKNGAQISYKWRVEFSLIVECILVCDDSLPTYARIKLLNKDRIESIKEVLTKS